MSTKTNNQGITLIEVIIVLTIFSIGLGAMLAGSVGLFTQTAFSGDFLIASHLAREGLEAVRNMRDENFLNERTWNHGFEMNRALLKTVLPGGVFQGEFQFEEVTYDMTTCVTVNKNCQMAHDPASGLYGDAGLVGVIPGAQLTKFYRMFEFDPIMCSATTLIKANGLCDTAPSDEQIGVKVTSRVQWYQGQTLREAVMTSYLYNWD